MLKTLLSQVKEYKTASLLAPLFTALEVVMELLTRDLVSPSSTRALRPAIWGRSTAMAL